jgi:hypothetical protein
MPLNVTFHDFFHELTHETLHVDGRVFHDPPAALVTGISHAGIHSRPPSPMDFSDTFVSALQRRLFRSERVQWL